MGEERKTEDKVGLIVGLVLVALGLAALTNVTFLPWLGPMRRVWSVGREISGPIALIILGAAILYYSRRGGFRAPARGQRLYRSRDQKMVAGVMGGLASYLGTDPTVLRLVTVAVAIFTPLPVVLAYIVAAIIVPLEPEAGAPRAPAAPPTRPPG